MHQNIGKYKISILECKHHEINFCLRKYVIEQLKKTIKNHKHPTLSDKRKRAIAKIWGPLKKQKLKSYLHCLPTCFLVVPSLLVYDPVYIQFLT